MNKIMSFLVVLTFVGVISSCKKSDPPLPDNLIELESSQLGFQAGTDESIVKLKLSRVTDTAIPVTITFQANGVTYGTEFTTTPAAVNNIISLTIPAGSSEVSFKVNRPANALLDGDETVTYSIQSVTQPVLLGAKTSMVMSFSEILSSQSTMEIDGGGATYINKVFIDLSANRQTPVNRANWDLAFYGGTDFRVLLNASVGAMAIAIDKTDLNQVTAQDTIPLVAKLSLNAFLPEAMEWVDDPAGDLSKTAIAAISATAADNKVYIINRGINGVPNRGWQKIRVIRNATGGYTLQYADIKSTTFKTLEITKDASLNFKYVHFGTGAVTVEPAKARWDIAWSASTNSTLSGTDVIPYYFQDLVLLNGTGGAEAAKVLTSTVSYADFKESNLTGLTFSKGQLTIGADWRRTSPAPAIVYDDRFYVVKDPAGNYYKLKFTSLTKDGVRGKPQIEYALVKKGS